MKWITSFLAVCVLSLPLVSWSVVDINVATEPELAAALKGVGVKKAKAIIDYRNSHGGFKNIDELAAVKGISQKTIEKNRKNITLIQK